MPRISTGQWRNQDLEVGEKQSIGPKQFKKGRVDVPWQVLKVAELYFHVALSRQNCVFRQVLSEELGLLLLTGMCSGKKKMNHLQVSN